MSEAQAITVSLGGAWCTSRQAGIACCPAHDDGKPSLSVSTGEGGALLVHCFAGCDFSDILAALRARGLLDGRAAPIDPPTPPTRRRADDRRALAARIWAGARPITGTLGELYLVTRAIRGPMPPSLRFDPRCYHSVGVILPAMVARVCDPHGALVGAHRTYLAEPGRKADVSPQRKMLGSCAGGAVHLRRGPGALVVAEGVETALSVADALADLDPAPSVWAALSTTGLRKLALPAKPADLLIASDGDDPGRAAAADLADRATRAGWRVRMMPAPEGCDWNTVAQTQFKRAAYAKA